ncbi:MAG: 50S ribosomal protein L29 [Candidatus Omnitrophica bacterium]|nr:50S ribosomal protein L29 [Candidatus Omnitrophota bacterium]
MSTAKIADLRSLSVAELGQKKEALQKELFELRQKKVTGQLEKPHQFRLVRRQIAQINTIQREKNHVNAK